MAIRAHLTGICPHCGVSNRFEEVYTFADGRWDNQTEIILRKGTDINTKLYFCKCANCSELILTYKDLMIHPLGVQRNLAPKEVPSNIKNDFKEACLVESLSPKASAALARRCLQSLLHEQGIKERTLNDEIEKAMENLPTHLSEAIDAIRNVGNFAAHEQKSISSGEILDVEAGEVEWTLDVLEQLFDFYYVEPAKTKAKKDALNVKLKEAGKPEMK